MRQHVWIMSSGVFVLLGIDFGGKLLVTITQYYHHYLQADIDEQSIGNPKKHIHMMFPETTVVR